MQDMDLWMSGVASIAESLSAALGMDVHPFLEQRMDERHVCDVVFDVRALNGTLEYSIVVEVEHNYNTMTERADTERTARILEWAWEHAQAASPTCGHGLVRWNLFGRVRRMPAHFNDRLCTLCDILFEAVHLRHTSPYNEFGWVVYVFYDNDHPVARRNHRHGDDLGLPHGALSPLPNV